MINEFRTPLLFFILIVVNYILGFNKFIPVIKQRYIFRNKRRYQPPLR